MSKLTAVKIKYDDNNLSEQIPIGVQAENVQVGNKNLPNTLTTINNTLQTLNNKINNIKFDKTLSQSGQGADAQATRELINEVKNDLMDLIDRLPFITVLDESEMDQWNQDKIYRLNNKLYIYQGTSWKPIQTSFPKSIKSTSISSDYRLRIDFTDDTFWRSQPINVGRKGTSITQVSVDKAASQLVFHFDAPVIIGYDEEETPITATRASFEIAQGPPGPRGPEGRGISNIMMDEDKHLIISYNDGTAPYQSSTSLEGVGITDVDINNQDYLVLTFSDGSTHTVEKSIKGPQGVGISNVDIDENDCLEVTYTNNSTYTIQNKPLRGAEGKGISQAGIDENNHLFIEYTDGTQYTSEQSLKGDPIHLYDQTAEILSYEDLNAYKTVGCYQVPANVASTLTNAPCKNTFVLYVSPIRTLNPQILSQSAITQENQIYTRIYKRSDNSWSKWSKIGEEKNELKTLSVTRAEIGRFWTSAKIQPTEMLTIEDAPRFIKRNEILTFEYDKPAGNTFIDIVMGKGFYFSLDYDKNNNPIPELQRVYNSSNVATDQEKTPWYRFSEALYNGNYYPVSKPYHGGWVELTPTWVFMRFFNGYNVIKYTTTNVGHSLNLHNASHIKFTVQHQQKYNYHIKIETDVGSFSTVFTNGPSEWAYAPFAYTRTAGTNVKFTYACPDLKAPIWIFGDSFLNYGNDRVLEKLLAKDKFKNICVCALGGAQAVETAWQDLTGEGLENGCPMKAGVTERYANGNYPKSLSLDLKRMVNMGYLPKYIIWAVGENTDFPATRAEWDKSELTQAQKQTIKDNEDMDTIYHLEHVLIPFCQENNIELILYKPPSAPKLTYETQIFHTKLHEKLQELRDQGYKVIDANGAVCVTTTTGTDKNNYSVSDRLTWGKTPGYSTFQKPYLKYTENKNAETGVITFTYPDGIHPSSYGAQIIADAYNDLEFQFVQ